MSVQRYTLGETVWSYDRIINAFTFEGHILSEQLLLKLGATPLPEPKTKKVFEKAIKGIEVDWERIAKAYEDLLPEEEEIEAPMTNKIGQRAINQPDDGMDIVMDTDWYLWAKQITREINQHSKAITELQKGLK